jgi:hypothetical protein
MEDKYLGSGTLKALLRNEISAEEAALKLNKSLLLDFDDV